MARTHNYKRTYNFKKTNRKSNTFNTLRLKDNLNNSPRSVVDENDETTALGLSSESVRINGKLELEDVPSGEHNTNQFLVLDGDKVKYRTGAEVLSDTGASDSSGTVTEVTVGTGLDVANGTTTPNVTLDLSELTDGTATVVGNEDEMIYLDNGTQKRKMLNEIKLSQFANDLVCFETAGGITAGAVIWQSFPFIVSSGTHSRDYFLDNDDTANSYRRWDSYDSSMTGVDYRVVTGQFVVPENCTLVAMSGVVSNSTSTNNPQISVYYGTVTESTSNTTLASAGSVTPSITTSRVPYRFSKTDFDTDLSAGQIVIPTISHADTAGTRSFVGSLTLKFITR